MNFGIMENLDQWKPCRLVIINYFYYKKRMKNTNISQYVINQDLWSYVEFIFDFFDL
jgi:hypothetical protein